MAKNELLTVLRGLLDDVLRARFGGVAYARLARAHGYADGYMRALLDAGVVEKQALFELVSDQRRRFLEKQQAA
jgi:hypothetical protein